MLSRDASSTMGSDHVEGTLQVASPARRLIVPLGLVLLLALGLRLWSIGWGMPFTLHGDEPKYLPKAVLMLIRGDLNPHYFENPPFLTYLFFAELNIYLWAGQLIGFLKNATDVGTQLLIAPTPLYLIARSTAAVLGTLTVLLTFLVARRVGDRSVGLIAALLVSVSFLQVRDSHYAVNDVAATFFLMLVAYLAVRLFESGMARYYLLGGCVLGIATATKYNAGLGAVLLVVAHLLREGRLGSLLAPRLLPLAGAALAAPAAFVAGNPYALLDSAGFIKGLTSQYGWTADPFSTSDVSIEMVMTRVLWVSEGPIVLVSSLVGFALMLLVDWRRALLIAAFPAAYGAFFLLGSDLFYARFAIPMLPFLEIFSAVAIARAIQAVFLRTGPLFAGTIAVLILAASVLPSLSLDWRHNTVLREPDTRVLLGRWVEENVPPGSKLAVEGYTFLDSEGRHIAPKGIEYSLEILPSLRVNPIEYYQEERFDYLIASSFVYGRYPANPEAHQAAIEAYQDFDRLLPLAATFSPRQDGVELPFVMDEEITPIYTVFDRDRPGPTIKVYRVAAEPTNVLYGVEWLSVDGPARIPTGQSASYGVAIRNSGRIRWQNDGFTAVRVGYRWLDEEGNAVSSCDVHTPIPRSISRGEETTVDIEVLAPSAPGRYTLRLDMVQENFAWFSSKGASTRDFTIDVLEPY